MKKEGNRHSVCICLATESIFTLYPSATKDFLSAVYISLTGLILSLNGLYYPQKGLNISHNKLFLFQVGLKKLNLYPFRRRSQNCSMEILSAPSTFNFETPFETFHSAGLTRTSKAGAY